MAAAAYPMRGGGRLERYSRMRRGGRSGRGDMRFEGGGYMPSSGPAPEVEMGFGQQALQPDPSDPTGLPPSGPTGPANPSIANAFSPSSPRPRFSARNPIGYNPTGDPYEMYKNERARAAGQEDAFKQQFGDLSDYYGGRESEAYDRINQLYGPAWGDQGGYNPDEIENILQRDRTERLDWRPEDEQGLYMTDEEWGGWHGDPDRALRAFDPGQLETLTDEGAKRQREQFGAGAGALRGATGQLRADYTGAIDPDRLRLDPGYVSGQERALGEGGAAIRGAIRGGGLDPSAEYMARRGVSDAEVEQLAEAGGQAAGLGYRNAMDELQRSAAASGTTDPRAIAQLQSRLERSSGAAATDAANRSRLEARNAQREALQAREDTRLGAARYRTGLEVGAEEGQQGRRLGAIGEREQLRMGGEQDISNRRLRAAEGVGQAGIGAEREIFRGGVGMEGDIAERGLGTGRYISGRQTDLAERAEERAAERSRGATQNRQANLQYAQGRRYGQGMEIGNTLSNRYRDIAEQRLGDVREGREAARGLLSYAGGRAGESEGNQLRAWDIGQRGTLGATQGMSSYDLGRRGQGFGSAFKQSLGQGLGRLITDPSSYAKRSYGYAEGGIIDEPTTAMYSSDQSPLMIGEAGPEAVIPLRPQTPEAYDNATELTETANQSLSRSPYRRNRQAQRGGQAWWENGPMTSPAYA